MNNWFINFAHALENRIQIKEAFADVNNCPLIWIILKFPLLFFVLELFVLLSLFKKSLWLFLENWYSEWILEGGTLFLYNFNHFLK